MSTYRIQLCPEFGFRDTAQIVPYLDALGISDMYLSPILAPREGSTHGYDVADPTRLNPALGTRADFEALVDAARARQMGILLDIVPNHMAASPENPWWRDVLTHGEGSEYAEFFDIDWRAPWPVGREKLLLPMLRDFYAACVGRGDLQVGRSDGNWHVRYGDTILPLDPTTCKGLDSVDELNRDPEALDELLSAQAYQLRHWKTGRDELNYRRFFNISDLVGVRVEDPRVRRRRHAFLGELWESGLITGLRVDHVDGLRDPLAYLEWLCHTFRDPGDDDPYVVVEKILAHDEPLPSGWPVAGTTGYDFLNMLNGVFVDPDGRRRLDEIYATFTGRTDAFSQVVRQKKRFVIDWLFRAELELLTRSLSKLAARTARGRDLTVQQLSESLTEISACLHVYRTYTAEGPVSAGDTARIEDAVELARATRPDLSAVHNFIEQVLLLDVDETFDEQARRFVHDWQQFTPPLMAKGLEDTSLYVYNHLISLNTVGGEPDEADVSLGRFHAFNEHRAKNWPGAMNATSTHDSKRGEDVRLRVDVLSEMPDEFRRRLEQWSAWNAPKRVCVERAESPCRNEEMLLYQTLLGSWPLGEQNSETYRQRLRNYLVKSAREAKEKTSWHARDEAHEHALISFAGRVLDDGHGNAFLEDFREFQKEVAFFGAMNCLAQVVLKVASPGVPDIYQGSEYWNLSLVDPDNRRPVDYGQRRDALREMLDVPERHLCAYAVSLLQDWRDARIKQFVTWRSLQLRRRHPELFSLGDYRPLYACDRARPYVCAFGRTDGERHVIAVAARRTSRLVEPFELPVNSMWKDHYLSVPNSLPDTWADALTATTVDVSNGPEGRLPLHRVFSSLPVALLFSD